MGSSWPSATPFGEVFTRAGKACAQRGEQGTGCRERGGELGILVESEVDDGRAHERARGEHAQLALDEGVVERAAADRRRVAAAAAIGVDKEQHARLVDRRQKGRDAGRKAASQKKNDGNEQAMAPQHAQKIEQRKLARLFTAHRTNHTAQPCVGSLPANARGKRGLASGRAKAKASAAKTAPHLPRAR